jgi:NDP-sugar pyrophosphorylase family protein
MQAVILAGGLGTRLGELTRTIPKPMVPVAGRPYLEHQLRELARQQLNDVVLLTGYLGEQIEEYFGTGDRWGLSVRYSREATPQGTGGALRDAAHLLAETFVLIYGDSYLPIEYAPVLRRLEDSQALAVAVVYDNREETTVRNNVAVGDDGVVSRYAKDAAGDDLRYVEAGVLALRRTSVGQLPPQGPASLERDLYPHLVSRRQLLAYITGQRFYDIGTPERLAMIEQVLRG